MNRTKQLSNYLTLIEYVRTEKFCVINAAVDKKAQANESDGRDVVLNKVVNGKRVGVFLDIDETYTRDVIHRALLDPKRNTFFFVQLGPGIGLDAVQLPEKCTFQWSEYERIDWDAVQAGRHKASSFMIRKGLSRKAQLAHYTNLHVCKNPRSILKTAIPKTIILDTWSVWDADNNMNSFCGEGLAEIIVSVGEGAKKSNLNQKNQLERCLFRSRQAMEEAENAFETGQTTNPPVWILKGSTVNKGAGIYIVHCYEQVVDICWSESTIREWVLQQYIASPLVLRKRKFHIRAYALAFSSLQVYLFRECLALCSGSEYQIDDTGNLLAHITNTAYQELDPKFKEEDCVLLWNENDIAPILLEDKICSSTVEASGRIKKAIDDMTLIIADLFLAYRSEFGVFAPIEGCFEHYGLDFMIDSDWNVFLLEVNPGPDFKQTGARLQPVIENLMRSTIDIVFRENLYPMVTTAPTDMILCYSSDANSPNDS